VGARCDVSGRGLAVLVGSGEGVLGLPTATKRERKERPRKTCDAFIVGAGDGMGSGGGEREGGASWQRGNGGQQFVLAWLVP
jgi:hypothetical protein